MSDFYGTVGAADSYHAARQNTKWALADNAAKQAALLLASQWIDGNYSKSFPGYPTGKREQTRLWPRANAFDIYGDSIASDTVPVQVEEATYEVALRQIAAPGALFKDWTPGKDIKSVSVEGAVSVMFAGAASIRDVQLVMPIVDDILRPILAVSGSTLYSGAVSRT